MADPVVLKTSTAPDADWADDNVSLQPTLHADVYRIRRMYCELETADTKEIMVCDLNNGNTYGIIGQANTYGDAGSRYFSLSSAYRCFLGRLQLTSPQRFCADGEALSHQVAITFPPLSQTGQASADVTISMDFHEALDWQPCIELEPKTEVTIKMEALLDDVLFFEMGVSFTCLEVEL